MDPYQKLQFEMAIDEIKEIFPMLAGLTRSMYKSYVKSGFNESQSLTLAVNFVSNLIVNVSGGEK